MAELQVHIDGQAVAVVPGTSVAAALLNHGAFAFRRSVQGTPRAPLCGMGICFECRVTVDGRAGERACMVICRDGMRIETASSRSASSETAP